MEPQKKRLGWYERNMVETTTGQTSLVPWDRLRESNKPSNLNWTSSSYGGLLIVYIT